MEQSIPRIIIPPITDDLPRPLWSVLIPTYNCANYLRETLASVLAQDPGPAVMQIQVVDDCSTLGLFTLGVRASLGRFDVSFPLQLLFAAWFAAMTIAPRRPAGWMAEKFYFPEKRHSLNRMLQFLHRIPCPASVRSPSAV